MEKDSALQAAREVKRILSSDGYQLKPHYHKQLNGPWYLIPPQIKTSKKGSPFYYLGKFSFSEEEFQNQPFLFSGVHVEKGTAGFPTKDTWFWQKTFIKRIKDESFEEDLRNLSKSLGDKVVVQIDGHHGEKPNRITDSLLYHWQDGNIVFSSRKLQKELNGGKDNFQVFKNVPSDDEGIPKIIEAVSADEWAWIDVYIGVTFSLGQSIGIAEQINHLWYKGLHILQKYASE